MNVRNILGIVLILPIDAHCILKNIQPRFYKKGNNHLLLKPAIYKVEDMCNHQDIWVWLDFFSIFVL